MTPSVNTLTPAPIPGLAISLASSFFGFYAHASFMAALHEAGVFPEQVAGTSAGALSATLCGAGLQGKALEEFVMQPGMRTCFWDWAAPLRLPGVATCLYSSGILSGNNAVTFLRERLKGAKLEDFQAPRVQLALTNLTKRKSVMINQGDAAEWVIASCSIPGLFCNRVIDGDRWCDGGVANDTPFTHWLNDDTVNTILIHRIEHTVGSEMCLKWPTLASGMAGSHDTITKTLMALRLKEAERSGKRIIEIVTTTDHPGLLPGKQRHVMMERGRASGAEALHQLKAAIA
jgi:predicted acylesterase/phospholipase RssA